jgi:hypothetical protein
MLPPDGPAGADPAEGRMDIAVTSRRGGW